MEQEEKEEDEKSKYDALEISDSEFTLCCCLFDTRSLRLHRLISASVLLHFLHLQTAIIALFIALFITLLLLRLLFFFRRLLDGWNDLRIQHDVSILVLCQDRVQLLVIHRQGAVLVALAVLNHDHAAVMNATSCYTSPIYPLSHANHTGS